MSARRASGALGISLVLLVSCRGVDDAAAALGEVPDTVSEGFRQVSVSSEGRVEIEAGRVETFDKADRTVFRSVRMKELDPEGGLVLEGGADRIEITGNQDGDAEGRIRIHDVEGDSRLEAENLAWSDSDRILTGRGPVTIETGDGLRVTGEGFSADMARETFTFTRGVEGRLELDDEDDTPAP